MTKLLIVVFSATTQICHYRVTGALGIVTDCVFLSFATCVLAVKTRLRESEREGIYRLDGDI